GRDIILGTFPKVKLIGKNASTGHFSTLSDAIFQLHSFSTTFRRGGVTERVCVCEREGARRERACEREREGRGREWRERERERERCERQEIIRHVPHGQS